MTWYVTFGQRYRHDPHPQGGHPDGWFAIEAETEEDARREILRHCGIQWCMIYDKEPDRKTYPRGELKRLRAAVPLTADNVEVGLRVRSLVEFAGVPKGTEGVIDEDYDRGWMVAWDLPDTPLPKGYREYDGKPAIASRILRDGFGISELRYLEVVR